MSEIVIPKTAIPIAILLWDILSLLQFKYVLFSESGYYFILDLEYFKETYIEPVMYNNMYYYIIGSFMVLLDNSILSNKVRIILSERTISLIDYSQEWVYYKHTTANNDYIAIKSETHKLSIL